MRTIAQIREDIERIEGKRTKLLEERSVLHKALEARPDNEGLAERIGNVGRGLDVADEELARLDREFRDNLRDGLASGRYGTESGDGAAAPPPNGTPASVFGRDTDLLRSKALRAVEDADIMVDAARERVAVALEAADDPQARLARYVVETSRREYFRAFQRWFNDPQSGHYEWTPEERDARRRVQTLARSMTLGTARPAVSSCRSSSIRPSSLARPGTSTRCGKSPAWSSPP